MLQIVECAPNFSEGRRADVVDAIVHAIEEAGPRVLSVSSDPDRNRTAVRFIGEPDTVTRAAVSAAVVAAQQIDMTEHSGDYPRIGATDVVPLAPLLGLSMEDCTNLARRIAERIGGELSVPVYLYGEAATTPARRDIDNVREGEYEGLRQAIGSDESRAPDFGPSEMGPAGATAVGARWPFVVYTLSLDTPSTEVAESVAAAIDGATGGLGAVTARAVPRAGEGGARVQARVTRPETTPLERVLTVAELEAGAHGATVRSAALDGLVPQSVLAESGARQLRLDKGSLAQTIEQALLDSSEEPEAVDVLPRAYVDAVSSDAPTPGGGSVAAVAASLGAALSGMVASLTIGQPKYADLEGDMRDMQARARQLQGALLELAVTEGEAFEAVMAAYRLPRSTADEIEARREAVEVALRQATEAPIEVMRQAVDALRLTRKASESGNINAVSDAGVAGYLGNAAVKSASLSVATNVMGLRDLEEGDRYRREADRLLDEAEQLSGEIDRVVRERIKG